MDTKEMARLLAPGLQEHQRKLGQQLDAASAICQALRESAEQLSERRRHGTQAAEKARADWTGDSAEAFGRRSARLGRNLEVTATTCGRAEAIVREAAASVSDGQQAVLRLHEEYDTRAARLLETGKTAGGPDAPAAMYRAVAEILDREVPQYTRLSAAELKRIDAALTEATRRLTALTHDLTHDDITEDTRRPIHIPLPDSPHGPPHKGDQDKPNGKRVENILDNARKHLGYHERGDNINKFGPDAPWCSSFVTSIWRDSGVDIGLLPATEDVYFWGKEHGQSYGQNNLDEVRPGDALLFGSGPTPAGSTHIGIVEKVEGNQVTLIEGNSDDQVQKVTHTLSPSTFYGGVHP